MAPPEPLSYSPPGPAARGAGGDGPLPPPPAAAGPPDGRRRLVEGLEDAAHHFSMALIASGTGAAVVYPIDMAKTKLQAAGPGGEGLNELQIICSTFREEGLAGVYSGLGAQLVGVAPEKSVKFFAYGLAHQALATLGLTSLTLELLAGTAGGIAQCVVTNPLEIVKIQLQLQKRGQKRCCMDIVKKLGVRGLYENVAVTIARDGPSAAIFFAGYAWCKAYLAGLGVQGFPLDLLSGVMAGVPAAYLPTPMDVVKTKLQADILEEDHDKAADPWATLRAIYAEEGLPGIMAGSVGRVGRLSPQLGVTLALYQVLDPVIGS